MSIVYHVSLIEQVRHTCCCMFIVYHVSLIEQVRHTCCCMFMFIVYHVTLVCLLSLVGHPQPPQSVFLPLTELHSDLSCVDVS